MKRKKLCLICVFLLLLLSSCGGESTRSVYVMDTIASFSLYPKNEKAADRIEDILFDISEELSPSDGRLSKINDSCGGNFGEHLGKLLPISQSLSVKTGGKFSPYLGEVIELWGIGNKNYIPDSDEVSKALLSAKAENIQSDGEKLILNNGARLNFGAVAKGYATDVIKEILEEENVQGAVVSIGGNVYVHGRKPRGEEFTVAIRDPQGNENDWLLSLPLSGKFVISSGDYERYFERNGKVYHHIIDPETGSPAESDLRAVCVISENGAMGDAYSTALYVMGKEEALSFWRDKSDFELVLIGRDNTVTLTEGISDRVVTNSGKEYVYEVARR